MHELFKHANLLQGQDHEGHRLLAMLALTMKRKKEGIVEEEVEEEFDIQGAEDKIRKDKNLYKSLTCIEFSNNAPVIVVGSADGTVGCYRLNGLDILPLSDKEQLDRLDPADKSICCHAFTTKDMNE